MKNNILDSTDDILYDLIANKDVLGYTWQNIADEFYAKSGIKFSGETIRKKAKRLRDNDLSITSSDYIVKARLRDENTQINAEARRFAREETIKEIAHEFAVEMSSKKVLEPVSKVVKFKTSTEAILLISDWHYGVEFDSPFNKFNTEVLIYRVNQLRDLILNYCKIEQVSNLHIVNLGDMIAGNIHLPLRINSRKDVISQIIEVSEILAEFITDLSSFCTIDYYSVIDNHSRIDPNKKEAIQLESLTRITDWYLKERLPWVAFHDNEFGPTMASFCVKGHSIIAVHGDKDKPKSIISKISNFIRDGVDMICSAHYHHFSINEENNCTLVSNGSLMGTDQFAFDLRLSGAPSQTLIIPTEDNVISKIYKINVD